jgi:hypothetical protein
MKKLLLFFVLTILSSSAIAELKQTYTPDGQPRLEWIDGYVDPVIAYARKTASGVMSDEEYLKASKAELRALIKKSEGKEARAAKFPKELDKYNH